MKNDIANIDDVRLLVNTFYGEIQQDTLIGPIFADVIKDWQPHLEKMYSFWQTVLLQQQTYFGRPFPPHAQMPLTAVHFERWLSLWRSTVDAFFEGEKAEDAKWRAKAMADMFLAKIEYYSNSNARPLL